MKIVLETNLETLELIYFLILFVWSIQFMFGSITFIFESHVLVYHKKPLNCKVIKEVAFLMYLIKFIKESKGE